MRTLKACTSFAKGLHMPACISNDWTALLVTLRLWGPQQDVIPRRGLSSKLCRHIFTFRHFRCISWENPWDLKGAEFPSSRGLTLVPAFHHEHPGDGIKLCLSQHEESTSRGTLGLPLAPVSTPVRKWHMYGLKLALPPKRHMFLMFWRT